MESLSDIERDLRDRADCAERYGDRETHNDGVATLLRSIADRIEAVAKRDAAIHAMTCEANERLREHLEIALEDNEKPVGNAAAMREAVVALLDALDSLGCDESTATLAAFVPDMADSSARCLAAFRKAKAALSAPARQCDVGTPGEQSERMEKAVCSKHRGCVRCPLRKAKYSDCTLVWAQTPYAEEGAGE